MALMSAMDDTLWADRWGLARVAEVGDLFLGVLFAEVTDLAV